MEITAHRCDIGIDENDEPFAYVWTIDEQRDFVFSLLRRLDGRLIEFMVRDQILEKVDDFKCQVDDDCIRAKVPMRLRSHTGGDEITVQHRCKGKKLQELVTILRRIFDGKEGLEVQVTESGEKAKPKAQKRGK